MKASVAIMVLFRNIFCCNREGCLFAHRGRLPIAVSVSASLSRVLSIALGIYKVDSVYRA